MNKIRDANRTLKRTSALIAILTGLLLTACNNETESSSSETMDSLSQRNGNDGVPLDNIERSTDTDTVAPKVAPNSGVSMDNLNRSPEDDTMATDED